MQRGVSEVYAELIRVIDEAEQCDELDEVRSFLVEASEANAGARGLGYVEGD